MPRYKLFYLRDSHVQKFRESPPQPKPYTLQARDYEEAGEIDAPGPYAVWKQLNDAAEGQDGRRVFGVGDVLEEEPSSVVLLNHWGFDEAKWHTAAPANGGGEAMGEPVPVGAAGHGGVSG